MALRSACAEDPGGSVLTLESDAWFIDRGHGEGCRRHRPFPANRRIREAIMNGYLPYSTNGPAPRSGGIRRWQEDILRGES
jgi:hypothetical protein